MIASSRHTSRGLRSRLAQTWGARALLCLSLVAMAAAPHALGGCADNSTDPGANPDDGAAAASASAQECACAPGVALVDPALIAFLSKAKALHNQADLQEEAGNDEAAAAALDKLVQGPVPGAPKPAVEVREVLADTLARLAEMRSAKGAFEAAERDVDRGLELARERTHFRGRLMEVRGVVEQRRYKKLAAAGDAGADAAKQRALKAFEEAVAIQDEVIRKALPAAPDDAPEPTP